MEELAYSLHLGSDKNRKNNIRKYAAKNNSKTSSLSNNAIQNARQLSKVDKHNYRKYDDMQDDIVIIRGTSSLYNDVKNLYKIEFEDSRLEYNSKQKRKDRMIDDYFENISNNDKKDLACEIIIELGDKKYWDTKNDNFKKRMTNVYTNQVKDLEEQMPNFKVASAIIHYDETSPHLHIVGIPVKEKQKNGMSKQVGKSDVFTKESLTKLQDKMRILCIESFNNEFKLDSSLKQKSRGRNKDINVSDMYNYQKIKDEIEINKKNIEEANKKSLKLDSNSKIIKDTIKSLKVSKFNKDNYILPNTDKISLISFIDKVDKLTNEYKNIQELSVSLKNLNDNLDNSNNTIKTLTENNKALNIRIKTLNKAIESKDNEISFLKSRINNLKNTLEYWKERFNSLITFLHRKLHTWYDKDEKYIDVINDMYEDEVLDEDNIKELDLNEKEKDDLEF